MGGDNVIVQYAEQKKGVSLTPDVAVSRNMQPTFVRGQPARALRTALTARDNEKFWQALGCACRGGATEQRW